MNVLPFAPYHLQLLVAQGVQPSQQNQLSIVPASYAMVGPVPGPALTVMQGDSVIICGGIVTQHPNYGILWAVLSPLARAHMLFLTRGTRRFIDCYPMRRLEATVEQGFAPGCRWLDLLGFRYEGDMPGYGDLGETHQRFGRVRV